MTKEEIVEFFLQHPEISLNQVEKKLNIPQSTLSKAVKKHRPIPEKYVGVLSDFVMSISPVK